MERERGTTHLAMRAAQLCAVGALGLAGGCAADGGDGGIIVLKNVEAGLGCVATSLDSETTISHGSLELTLPTDYVFIAQMKSRITALTGQEDQRTIITSGAKVDVTFPSSTLFSEAELTAMHDSGLTHFKSLFSAPILPNGGIQDGGFTLIPAELVSAIAAKAGTTAPFRIEVLGTFTIEGDMSGETVSSQPFGFPVTLGTGVSIHNAGICPLPASPAPRTGYVCNPLQDGVVDCCTKGSATGPLVCPATTASS